MDTEDKGLRFIGLDIETTGSEHRCQLIQIGASLGKGVTFSSDVGHNGGSYIVFAKALEVNGFSLKRIEQGPRPEDVDELLFGWLGRQTGISEGRRLVAIGWNVGSFDLPFVRATLPKSAAIFSRRSIDLNSICFLYGGEKAWTGYKEQAKAEAERILVDVRRHDAGYDAEEAFLSFAYLRSRLAILDKPLVPLVKSSELNTSGCFGNIIPVGGE